VVFPDQETEETQPYAPKAGAISQVWEQRGRKKKNNGFLNVDLDLLKMVNPTGTCSGK
jgi:hypothetical protein